MKRAISLISTFVVVVFLVLLTPKNTLADCVGASGKTSTCSPPYTMCSNKTSLCCNPVSLCTSSQNADCSVNTSATQCLASLPIGCDSGGPSGTNQTYCCATDNDCTLLNGTIDVITSHSYPTSQPSGNSTQNLSSVTCDNNTGIQTAIGCIHALGNTDQFLADILRWAVGVGGGIAFLLMIYAGFLIMTASGNPERLKAGQELLTSAISGLILLIFSVFLLSFIGINILQLGSFGFGK